MRLTCLSSACELGSKRRIVTSGGPAAPRPQGGNDERRKTSVGGAEAVAIPGGTGCGAGDRLLRASLRGPRALPLDGAEREDRPRRAGAVGLSFHARGRV